MVSRPPAPGRTRRVTAEGYIPGWSAGPEPRFLSHEMACILNAGDNEALVPPSPA